MGSAFVGDDYHYRRERKGFSGGRGGLRGSRRASGTTEILLLKKPRVTDRHRGLWPIAEGGMGKQ